MKILAVADEECKALWDYFTPDKLEGVELIIACGDLSRHYLEYLATMAPVPLLYVHGNHDESYDTRPPQGVICLDDDVYVHNGLRIAGLGGSAELLGTQFRLINGFGNGYGFDGVAMALIGQLHPIATMVVALFFSVLRVGSTTMQAATGVPTSVSDIIQALVIVFSVAGMALTKLPEFQSWKSRVFGKRKAGAV